jgi:pimeloyl-ACP methyl ester carboxylesterase
MKSNELLLDAFGRIRETVEAALEGVDDDALVRRPGGTGNSIVWLVWHLSRVEDAQVASAAGLEQVWTAQDFVGRFGLPLSRRDTGYGHTTDQVDSVRARPELLLEYYDSVHRQTVGFLETLDDADLDRVVDQSWDPTVTLGVRLVSTFADCLQHVGQAAYAKGLKPERNGKPITGKTEAVLHDGTTIPLTVRGGGPAILLPVSLAPHTAAEAETLRQWGGDPDLGPNLVEGLAGTNLVIAADYEAHRMAHPAPLTLTPENIAADLLAIADAAGAETLAYYGYSWLALSGLQLALRTDRLRALAMGGFPPLDGPYQTMLTVTRAAHVMSVQAAGEPAASVPVPEPGDWDSSSVQTTKEQTQQFVTLYEALQDFDDIAAVLPADLPRLAFAGAEDSIDYKPVWGGVRVKIGEPLARHQGTLTKAGWDVRVLPGLDHMGAMHSAVVLPILKDWLQKAGWVK